LLGLRSFHLTDKSIQQLAAPACQTETLNEFMVAEFDSRKLAPIAEKLVAPRSRI
jgi:hypothetical protein